MSVIIGMITGFIIGLFFAGTVFELFDRGYIEDPEFPLW